MPQVAPFTRLNGGRWISVVLDGQTLFEEFVREHATSLLRTSFLLTGDRSSAEDLLQETLTRLYPKWIQVSRAQAPVAYVRRCLMNEFINSRRRRAVQLVDFDITDRARSGPAFEDDVAARDATIRLLDKLNERQRAAVVLRYFHDLDDSEIGELLGCRQVTVRSLVSRGLIAMRAAQALVS